MMRPKRPLVTGHWSLVTRGGQAFVEYAILFAVVAAALLGMQLYAKRSLQGGIKMAVDRMSPHPGDVNGEQAQADGKIGRAHV